MSTSSVTVASSASSPPTVESGLLATSLTTSGGELSVTTVPAKEMAAEPPTARR